MDLSRFVSNTDQDVFAVLGLPEEVIAVLFARYSRSRGDLRTNMAAMLQEDFAGEEFAPTSWAGSEAVEKARRFHEKWVVGYGHASVAEHAIVHMAVENRSILCAKALEDARLASFTEKSTRYVVFDRGSFVTPLELGGEVLRTYQDACHNLFDAYQTLMPAVVQALEARALGASATAIQAQACDALRGLLPASTKTNVGITANARALESMLSKAMSSPLHEVWSTAELMAAEGRLVAPTLLKYATENPFRTKALERGAVPAGLRAPSGSEPAHGARVVSYQADALARVALALVDDGTREAAPTLDWLRRHPEEALAIVRAGMEDRGSHDAAPRAFEHTSITVELTLDYGAYRDLQRHRMLSPTVPTLTADLGFEVPALVVEAGLEGPYVAAMLRAKAAWEQLCHLGRGVAQYAVPLGYRVRVLWTMNLRELFHVIELRSAKQGHPSYRRIVQQLYREVVGVLPWLDGVVRVDLNDYALARG